MLSGPLSATPASRGSPHDGQDGGSDRLGQPGPSIDDGGQVGKVEGGFVGKGKG
jgi:hypothetical protein